MITSDQPLDDPFEIEIVAKNPRIRKLVMEKITAALNDPSLDEAIERILQEEGSGSSESQGSEEAGEPA